jgi:uncharacterized membrane protein YdjX (TVP38/TMEM64 family)
MLETLHDVVTQAGPFAPLLYIALFLVTALLPFIPTPLVVALGGSVFGSVPAILYGVLGLGLGAFLALSLARRLGRPVVIRLVGAKQWEDWELLLGIRSPVVWGIIFFILNIDFAVVAAGLSGLPLRTLWITAVVARFPWVVASAYFGETLLRSDRLLPQALLLALILFVVIHFLRKGVRRYLVQTQVAPPEGEAAAPGAVEKKRAS